MKTLYINIPQLEGQTQAAKPFSNWVALKLHRRVARTHRSLSPVLVGERTRHVAMVCMPLGAPLCAPAAARKHIGDHEGVQGRHEAIGPCGRRTCELKHGEPCHARLPHNAATDQPLGGWKYIHRRGTPANNDCVWECYPAGAVQLIPQDWKCVVGRRATQVVHDLCDLVGITLYTVLRATWGGGGGGAGAGGWWGWRGRRRWRGWGRCGR
jgi:hypothetical protein